MKIKFLVVTVTSFFWVSSMSAQTPYPIMQPQQALELATADPSMLSESEYLDFNVAVLNLINLPDLESYVSKMYNYYHGEVEFTSLVVRCRGKKIIPHLQLMLKQDAPICPWGSAEHPSRRYACYETGSEWSYKRGLIKRDIEIISKTHEKKRFQLCLNLSKSYLEAVSYINKRKHQSR